MRILNLFFNSLEFVRVEQNVSQKNIIIDFTKNKNFIGVTRFEQISEYEKVLVSSQDRTHIAENDKESSLRELEQKNEELVKMKVQVSNSNLSVVSLT